MCCMLLAVPADANAGAGCDLELALPAMWSPGPLLRPTRHRYLHPTEQRLQRPYAPLCAVGYWKLWRWREWRLHRVSARRRQPQRLDQRAARRRPRRARRPQGRHRRPAPAPAAPRGGVEQGDPAGARRSRAARLGRLRRQYPGPAQDLAAGGNGRTGGGRAGARPAPCRHGLHGPGRRTLRGPARDGGERDCAGVRPGRQRAGGRGRGRPGGRLGDRGGVPAAGRAAEGASGRGVAGPGDRGAGADGRGRPLDHGAGAGRGEVHRLPRAVPHQGEEHRSRAGRSGPGRPNGVLVAPYLARPPHLARVPARRPGRHRRRTRRPGRPSGGRGGPVGRVLARHRVDRDPG